MRGLIQPLKFPSVKPAVGRQADSYAVVGRQILVAHLPENGIQRNTHFAFSGVSNVQTADLVLKFLSEKGLD